MWEVFLIFNIAIRNIDSFVLRSSLIDARFVARESYHSKKKIDSSIVDAGGFIERECHVT